MSDQARPLVALTFVTASFGERATFTIPETAQLLGVSEYVVRQEIKAGRLHVVECGPRVRLIPAWSIDQLLGTPVAAAS